MMTSLPAADCSTFLPLRREKLDRQWFGDGSVVIAGGCRPQGGAQAWVLGRDMSYSHTSKSTVKATFYIRCDELLGGYQERKPCCTKVRE